MTDTPTNTASYTLESSTFLNSVQGAVAKAKNDIATIDNEIGAVTAEFRAAISSRQARKADLQIIIAHGEALLQNVTNDVEAIGERIKDAVAKSFGDVGDDIMADLKKLTAPVDPPATPAAPASPAAGIVEPPAGGSIS